MDLNKDNDDETYYITTAIAYMNGEPHIGHLYEYILADFLARYKRLVKKTVFFVTGSDEYGEKVENKAILSNFSPKEWVDLNVKKFFQLNDIYSISFDKYIRTTDKLHFETVNKLWNILDSNGYIYKGIYDGWYDLKEETFINERDAAKMNYMSSTSNQPLVKKTVDVHFFKLSLFHNFIFDLIANTDYIVPEFRKKDLITRLSNEPLQDICVSRKNLNWGIPVPGDSEYVIYVWIDALTNYLSALNYMNDKSNLKNFWPADCQVIGKDIIWFHAIIWPAILKASNIRLPNQLYVHNFIQDASGQKLSKSLNNNPKNPIELVKNFDSDTIRWFLLKETTLNLDLKYDDHSVIYAHNADLCGCIGNLISRMNTLVKKYCDSIVPDCEFENIFDVEKTKICLDSLIEGYKIGSYVKEVLSIFQSINKYLTDNEPWNKRHNDSDRKKILLSVLEATYAASFFLKPIIPNYVKKIFAFFYGDSTDYQKLGNGKNLKIGQKISASEHIAKFLDLNDYN